MYEIYERYKTFRKIHFTLKKIGFSFAMAAMIALVYLNYILISDYKSLNNNQRNVSAQDAPVLSDNESTGKISVENSSIKAVWHYKILPSEYNNRGGGNIYELYDKRTDPQSSLNMVGVNDYGGGGTHSALTGIGGLGVTALYDSLDQPPTGDNGSYAVLVSKSANVSGGSASVIFVYRVKSNTVRDGNNSLLEDYLLTKNWTMTGNTITVSIKAEMLRDARVSEPRISFNFKRNYWDRADIYGHDMLWPNTNCQGPNTDGFSNPHNGTTTWDLNDSAQNDKCYSTRHSEKLTLDGSKSDVVLKIDNGGKGFESGGMFNYGYSLWGTDDNHMSTEFVLGICGRTDGGIPENIPGAVDLHWFPWWGGGPPTDERYKDAKSSDVFMDDTFKIEIIAPEVVAPPSSPAPDSSTPSSQNPQASGSTQGGQTQSNGSSLTESTIPEEKKPSTAIEKIADSVGKIFDAPTKLMKSMPLWQQQVILAVFLTLLVVEMVIIDKFTHVSKWLLYLYRHYIKRVY